MHMKVIVVSSVDKKHVPATITAVKEVLAVSADVDVLCFKADDPTDEQMEQLTERVCALSPTAAIHLFDAECTLLVGKG